MVESYSALPDPLNDRKCSEKECPKLINKPLEDSVLFSLEGGLPDWKLLKDFLSREGPITKPQCVRLLQLTIDMLKKDPNLVHIEEPICVVGDIHGQYYDLLNMISKVGEPGTLNYLFLGDYVDRGILGIEVCLLLFAIKLSQPKNLAMLRGNHESRNMTEAFTFRIEVLDRYDAEVYDLFMEAFDAMPISALVAKKYLAMHGGISPDLNKIEEINQIDRFAEIPLDGVFCDLMWADPLDDE
jgi:serine/threonine-protein phosphatase 2B catalytic subunit